MFKVLIVGAEKINNYELVEKKCINILKDKAKNEGIMIYYVGDSVVDKFADKFGIDTRIFTTDFKRYKHDAYKKRNEEIFVDCDAVIGFDQNYNETKHLSKIAKEKGLPVRIINL